MKSLLVVMVLVVVATAQPVERAPALVVDVSAPNGELDAAQVRDAIARELAVDVTAPGAASDAALGTLRVIATGDAVRVVYERPGRTAVERSLELPPLPGDRVQLVTYAASNMIRDQAGELLAQLDQPPPAPPTAPVATQLPPMPPPSAPAPRGRRTYMWLALGLSLGGTLASVPFFAEARSDSNHWAAWTSAGVAVLVAGPSAGTIYAHSLWSWGLVVRLAAAGLFTGAMIDELTVCRNGCALDGAIDNALVATSTLYFAGGLMLVGTIGDIVTAPFAARRYNRAHGWAPAASLAPIAVPHGAGLGLVGTF